MDLERECSVPEAEEDNEEIANHFVSRKNEDSSESKVQINGSCAVENDDNNELFPKVKQKGAQVSVHVNSPCLDLEPEKSLSPTTMRKGYGLKKWRRINRDAIKLGDSYVDTGIMETRDLSNSGVNPSKRTQYAERKQKTEGSVSSTNAVVRSLDGFAPLDDSFAAGTDSENSEDRSSKSSTAASAPRMKYEMPVSMGLNLSHLVQQGKGRIEMGTKARGERVKIEKENSHSSVESDLRSSNFVFMQGTYSTNNGIRHERPKDNDGENGYENNLPSEDVVADSSSEVKEERSQNHDSSRDQDALVECIFAMQSVQDALGKELMKFKEMSQMTKDIPIDDVEATNRDVVTESEDLFKQKLEVEVVYLVISRTVHNLRVLEEQKDVASEQTQILDKLENSENKAAKLEKEAKKLEIFCEDIEIAEETLKLQKKVCKYSSCLLAQIVFLLLIVGVFMQLSPNSVEVVPT